MSKFKLMRIKHEAEKADDLSLFFGRNRDFLSVHLHNHFIGTLYADRYVPWMDRSVQSFRKEHKKRVHDVEQMLRSYYQ